ncbi:hypothetical protein CKJ55_25325 [Mycobacterium avium]|nr:hypothetical protein CKJ55_25325 [Mycobacterium avium]PBA81322.1 hypothetical protein CKJ71_25335 [Mycobacterium avium]
MLAVRWLADGRTPSWAATHTPRGWARLLAAPAAHGWTPDDLNLAIHEWKTVNRRYLPVTPYRPIGLLGAILRTHDLAAPPAAMDRARQAAHRAQQLAEAAADRAEAAAKTACAATADQRAAARALFAENRKRFRR